MTKKLALLTAKGLEVLTDVRFICGVLTGSGIVAFMLGSSVGFF